MDILDKLRQKNREQGDIIDQLYAKQPKTRPIVPQVDEATKRALTVKSLRESGSAGGAFLADIGATLNKAIPNLKRVINPNDKEALEELKEIEDFQDILRTAFPSAVFGGEVALPSATAAATMGFGALPAVGAGMTEAAAVAGSEQDPRVNAAIAGVLPFIPDAVKKLGSASGELVEQFARRTGDIVEATPEKQAGRALSRYIREADIDPESVLDQRALLGRGSTLADVPEMQGIAQQTALTPSGRTYMKSFENRQFGQQQRIKDKLSEITGKYGEDFTGDLDSFMTTRQAAAEPLYNAAWEREFIPSEGFENLFKRLKNSGAIKEASDIAKIEGTEFVPENVNYKTLHSIKMGIDGLIEAEKSGKRRSGKIGALRKLKDDLLEEIEDKSGNADYKMARLQFAGDSGVINAAELGADIFNPKIMGRKISNDQLAKEVSKMSADEFTAFQGGMTKAVADRIEKIPETADAALRFGKRPEVRNALKLAFENERQFETFLSSLDKETQFTNTLRTLYQGSQTAQRQAAATALKTGDIAALEPFKKILKGEISPDGITELSRLMFDPKVSNDQIRRTMIAAGVVQDTATTKAIAAMRNKWESVWSRVNLPGVTSPQKAAIASKLAQMNEEEL